MFARRFDGMHAAAGTVFAGLLVVAALMAPLFLPVHLKMTVSELGITIEPRGFDAIWLFRRRIFIPADEITSIRVVPRAQLTHRGIRLPGVCLPGIIIAGTISTGDEQVMWDVRRGDDLLVVYCRADAPRRSYVLEFPDPHAVLTRAQAALNP